MSAIFFPWKYNESYDFTIQVLRDEISICYGGTQVIWVRDSNGPYLNGMIGLSLRDASQCEYKMIGVKPIQP